MFACFFPTGPWLTVNPSSDINHLVMNYLINEGYQAAALNFSKEAGIQPQVDWNSMDERIHIRDDIHKGNIQSAIERINALYPQVSFLYIYLPKSPSIAMIRQFSCTTLRPSGR